MFAVVAPGEDVSEKLESLNIDSLGGGFTRLKDGRVLATQAGPLISSEGRCWIAESNKRGFPREGDVVVGIVEESVGDHYNVDIGGPRIASLDVLAFDGATRRNCPNLERGALVFARVIKSDLNAEPRLSCEATGTGKKKDWTTGETQFGELRGGCSFEFSRAMCRRLSEANSPLLAALADHIPFEICIGFNGRIWIDAEDPKHVVLIAAAIRASEGRGFGKAEAGELVKSFLQSLQTTE